MSSEFLPILHAHEWGKMLKNVTDFQFFKPEDEGGQNPVLTVFHTKHRVTAIVSFPVAEIKYLLDKGDLRKGGFIFSSQFKVQPAAGHVDSTIRKKEEGPAPSSLSPFIHSRVPTQGMVLPTIKMALPTSANVMEVISHRHSQRLSVI